MTAKTILVGNPTHNLRRIMVECRRNWELNFLFPTFRRAGFTRHTSTHFFVTDSAFQKPYR
jgi:hypothetical protein